MKKFKVSVIIRGELIRATSDGTKEGTQIYANSQNRHLIEYRIYTRRGVKIRLSRKDERVIPGYDSPLALTAVLCSLDAHGAIIWSAPKEVVEYLNSDNEDRCIGSIEIRDSEQEMEESI